MAFSKTSKWTDIKKGVVQVVLTLLDTAGDSDPLTLADAETISLQFGLAGTAGTIKVQVSNDGATYFDAPTAISKTAAGVGTVAADSRGFKFYRLNLAGGDATTAWTVNVVASLKNMS